MLLEFWLWGDAFGTRKLFSDVGDEAFTREPPKVEFLLPFELELLLQLLLPREPDGVLLPERPPCFEVELRMASNASQIATSLVVAVGALANPAIVYSPGCKARQVTTEAKTAPVKSAGGSGGGSRLSLRAAAFVRFAVV